MSGSLDHASPGHHTTPALLKIRVTPHPGEPSEHRRGREETAGERLYRRVAPAPAMDRRLFKPSLGMHRLGSLDGEAVYLLWTLVPEPAGSTSSLTVLPPQGYDEVVDQKLSALRGASASTAISAFSNL